MRKQTPETFWEKVAIAGKKDCWEWQHGCGSNGYAQARWHGKNCPSHRIAAWLAGKLSSLDSEDWVLHLCDNPKCCNPSHLQVGDAAENSRQAAERGRRNYHGELSPLAKLTNKQAEAIRKLYSKGKLSQREIADIYGVAQTNISAIVRRETFRRC